jgi:type VI protein secretion system component VasF
MKKLLMIPVIAATFASCGGGSDKCDPATAEGAAKCLCEMGELSKEEDKDKAQEKMTDLMKKMEDIEKNIKDGKYSESDVETAAGKIEGCEI